MEVKKIMIISIVVIFLIITILGITKLVIEKGAEEIEKKNYGEIPLPGKYIVMKIHAQEGNIITNIGDPSKAGVDKNVIAVGHNGKIIAFKRESNNKVEYGFIYTNIASDEMKSNIEITDELIFNKKIRDLNIKIMPVEELFPEVHGDRYEKLNKYWQFTIIWIKYFQEKR